MTTYTVDTEAGVTESHDALLRSEYMSAVERSVSAHLALTGEGAERIRSLTLRDIRGEKDTGALLERRSALGLSLCPNSRVLVDEHAISLSL